MEEFIVAITTTASEKEAAAIARTLVERQQAACVNVIPSVRSVYRWKEKTCNEVEQLLLIKTTRALFGTVSRTIRELHSYELPDIVALPVAAGDDKVLAWIRSCLTAEPGPPPDRPNP